MPTSSVGTELDEERAWHALRPGARLEHYEIEGELGQGGSGVVYAARDSRTGERLALKCLRHARAEALRLEFCRLADVKHPNVVRLGELGQSGAITYFTMERLDGVDVVSYLSRWSPRARAGPARACFAQLADALSYLHARGLVHRDIKAANVMIDARGKVALLDFGLTSPVVVEPAFLDGRISGTLAYLAPECLRGAPPSPAVDWFAFGVLLFESLRATLPFGPQSRDTIMAWFAGRAVPDLRAKLGLEFSQFAELLEGLLDPDPERRPSGSHVAAALGGPRRGPPSAAPCGRERDLAWLLGRLSDGSSARVVAISGESGIGKSALLEGLRRDERAAAACVIQARCRLRDRLPFNALHEIVAAVSRLASSASLDAPSRELGLLRCLFDKGAPPEAERSQGDMIRALRVLIEYAARGRELWILVDDLQWADHDSVAALRGLWADAACGASWVVTVRGELLNVPEDLRGLVTAHHQLAPLDPESSLQLVRRLLPGAGEAEVRALGEVTGGHPLAIEQACAIREPDRAPSGWWTPERLSERQLELQPRERLELLDVLALVDAEASAELLSACGIGSVSDVYELVDGDLLNFERRGAGYVVSIRHERLAELLRRRLGAPRRHALHSRIAAAYSSVSPDDVEPRFLHLREAGCRQEAIPFALRSARDARDRLAFRRSIERFQWLIEGEEDAARGRGWRLELASVLARAGMACEAADAYLLIAESSSGQERLSVRCAAAEQLLRSGRIDEGRRLLDACAELVGLPTHRGLARRLLAIAWRRMSIARRCPNDAPPRSVSEPLRRRMAVAWSAGLGLNLVDVVASALAQSEYTRIALRHGDEDERTRAWAVEYSFAMNAKASETRRGQAIRRFLEGRVARGEDPYTRGIAQLSWAAGDYFRGAPASSLDRARGASADFSTMLGSLSWELANCGLYETWSLLEVGRLSEFCERVPALLQAGHERGDDLYRMYWTSGHAAAAWLVLDRPDELERLSPNLDWGEVRSFQMEQVFRFISEVRLALYRGRGVEAFELTQRCWGPIHAAGLTRFEWFRFSFELLRLQTVCVLPSEEISLARVERWIGSFARCRHPASRPWTRALRAWLAVRRGHPGARLAEEWGAAATEFEGLGFVLVGRCLRQELYRGGWAPPPRWEQEAVRADRLAVTFGLRLPT